MEKYPFENKFVKEAVEKVDGLDALTSVDCLEKDATHVIKCRCKFGLPCKKVPIDEFLLSEAKV